MKTKQLFLRIICILALSVFSIACSMDKNDQANEAADINSENEFYQGAQIVHGEDELPGCHWFRKGQVYYIKSSGEFKFCNGEEFEPINLTNPQGNSITWLGTFENHPENPNVYDAYYNLTENITYIWSGGVWEIMLKSTGSGVLDPEININDNLVTLEIESIDIENPVVIIKGPGADIERLPGYQEDGKHFDLPGLTQEHLFVFEASGQDAERIKDYFYEYRVGLEDHIRTMSIIVRFCPCFDDPSTEVFRFNLFEFAPVTYVLVDDGRTRFTLATSDVPDARWNVELDGPMNAGGAYPIGNLDYNPEADKWVEIQGRTQFYPTVEVNEQNRTVTLTYGIIDGIGDSLFNWVTSVSQFQNDLVDMSIADVDENLEKTNWVYYYRVFPIQYEIVYGFGQAVKLRERIVLSYGWSEAQ